MIIDLAQVARLAALALLVMYLAYLVIDTEVTILGCRMSASRAPTTWMVTARGSLFLAEEVRVIRRVVRGGMLGEAAR